METFLNVALLSLILIGLIVFLRSPLEIIKNFLTFILKSLFGIFWDIMTSFFKTKNKKTESKSEYFESIIKENNSKKKLKLKASEFSSFVIIKGDFVHSVIKSDIEEALSHLENGNSIGCSILNKGKTIIVQLTQVDSIADLMFISQFIANSYGTDNTYGFQRSKNLSLFFIQYADPDLTNIIGGITSENERFFFSFENPKMDKNTIHLNQSVDVPKDLNTAFFEHLTKE
jgi:hypothetical protein